MGQWLSTSATAAAGTKAFSTPRKKYGRLKKMLCFTAVAEGNVEVVECFGRFRRIAHPGFNCIWSCCGQGVAGRLSTQLQHQEVQAETKTRDGVFIETVVSIQYRVAEERQYEAFYSMAEPQSQVTSYVLDAMGTAVSGMGVEDVFLHKAELVAAVRQGLSATLYAHGYAIEDCLFTVIAPTASVKEAMSNVMASRRQRESAFEQGEADKLRTVKGAEGSSESKYLQGQGLARFLIALAAGIRDSAKVLVTGRIKQEDLSFPQPPPADDLAALQAAGVQNLPPAGPSDGASGRGGSQEAQQRKAPQPGALAAAGKQGPLSEPLLGDSGAAGPAQQGKLVARVGQPAMMPPMSPATPSKGGAAGTISAGGAAKGALTAAGL